MKTLDERIEAAARESAVLVGDPADTWPDHVEDITCIIIAAFPELFTDPPSAWIAPWEDDIHRMTEEELLAGLEALIPRGTDDTPA